jgi:hypothetical protein
MKYPKLPESLDLRKKLMAQDIADIQRAYKEASPFPSQSECAKRRRLGLAVQSESQWITKMMEVYQVSYHTIYYWVRDDYREYKRGKNAKAHSKADLKDYRKHVANELEYRRARWNRFPAQWDYHTVQSAKNEKRTNRYTVHGQTLEQWGEPTSDNRKEKGK